MSGSFVFSDLKWHQSGEMASFGRSWQRVGQRNGQHFELKKKPSRRSERVSTSWLGHVSNLNIPDHSSTVNPLFASAPVFCQ
jgi:hypothetical protein